MAQEVFISYSRSASSSHAEALAAKLGNVAFFDSVAIPDGDEFPPRLLNAVLNARVIVILATKSYSERPFCRLEMRLALAAADLTSSHIVLALGEGASSVLDALPQSIASQNWPPSGATDLLEGLVRDRLTRCSAPLRSVLVEADARRLAATFLEESNIPEARSLDGIVCSLPQGIASQSIGSRFVGRAGELRRIHQILTDGSGSSARLTIRITAGAGFGKTRLATEYLYRYGPRYYPGGLFWVNAASSSIDDEFWRILSVLDPEIPNLAAMQEQKRNVSRELERALRGIHAPVLYVIDNIPEAGPGEDAPPLENFCPALGAVTVLATSRQDTREEGVKTISVDTLVRDAAILLLTDNLPGAGRLSWNDWDRIANWVGDLPLVLDLLNCCLALSSIPFEELLQRATTVPVAASEVEELDHLRDALRGQIPRDSVRGIGEAFAISFEKLSDLAKESAMILAQLAPAPIPEALIDAMHEDWKSPAVRAALHSRHYVIAGGNLTFGVMHRLLADFLRNQTGDLAPKMLEAACMVVDKCMTIDRCGDPRQWPVMNLVRPHATELVKRASLTGNAVTVVAARIGETLAALAFAQGEYAEQRRLCEMLVEMTTRALGEEHPETLQAMSNYAFAIEVQGDYKSAQPVREHVLELRTRLSGDEDSATLSAMSDLAKTLRNQSDSKGARRLQERALELRTRLSGEESSEALSATRDLAETLVVQKDFVGAHRLQERVLQLRTRLSGEDNSDTLSAMRDLAATLVFQKQYVEAQRLYERQLEARMRQGEKEVNTLKAMSELAEFLELKGDLPEAQRLEERALELKKLVLTKQHPLILDSMARLARIRFSQGDYAEARCLFEGVIGARTLGEDHPLILNSMDRLVATLLKLEDWEVGQRLAERVVETKVRVFGAEDLHTLTSMISLAAFLVKTGDAQKGLQLLRQCVAGRRKLLGDQHPDTTEATEWLLGLEGQLGSGGEPETGESKAAAS